MTCKPSIQHHVSETSCSITQGLWLLAHLVPCSMATAEMSWVSTRLKCQVALAARQL